MRYIIPVIFFVFLFNIPISFGLENQSNSQIEKLQNEISEIKKKTDQNDWEIYGTIAGILVALSGVFLSNHQTRKSNRIAMNAFDNSRKTTEADLLLRLNDSIYRSEEGKKIIECMRLKKPVLEKNKGDVIERELENFLNEVETVAIFISKGTLTSTMAEQGFGWVIKLIKENKEIMDYIKKAQEQYGDYAWIEITNYSPNPNFKQNVELPSKKIKLSELRIARIQIWSSTITALGAVSFGIGATMWITELSMLGSADTSIKEPIFLNSLLTVFGQLSPLFTILGLAAILYGFIHPMIVLRENQDSTHL